MVLLVNAGVVNEAPVNTTVESAALLYQVNTGLITVVLVAVSVVVPLVQIVVEPDTATSVDTALGLTITVTVLALAELFSHLLAPFTVT